VAWSKERNPLRTSTEGIKVADCTEPRLTDGIVADESTNHEGWLRLPKGEHEFVVRLEEVAENATVHLGALNYVPDGVCLPERIALYGSEDGTKYTLLGVEQPYAWPNNRHDAWVQEIAVRGKGMGAKYLKVVLTCPSKCYIDELRVGK
jgi:hypothetical protein